MNLRLVAVVAAASTANIRRRRRWRTERPKVSVGGGCTLLLLWRFRSAEKRRLERRSFHYISEHMITPAYLAYCLAGGLME